MAYTEVIIMNPDLKERYSGFFFMSIYVVIFFIYIFFDGWLYEWIIYGYKGANQHWDLNILGDMIWSIKDGHPVYQSTNNLHNLVYICYWTGAISYSALITDNKWLRQGAIATVGFPIMSFFSTINPVVASDIFTTDIFHYHSYLLQVVYDINHLCGITMGLYLFYSAARNKEEINMKLITPAIFFTWILFFATRILLQKWPFWAAGHEKGLISTNQINDMPFVFYGFEYGIIVIPLLYAINVTIKKFTGYIKDPVKKTAAVFIFFSVLTMIFVLLGFIKLQVIPIEFFIQ
ncbi:MAG: hypothetical protein JW982_08215 [Spirochaetes bacterium]|nr:hypothetical protein [Spirochaetota bacterium]